MYRIRFKYGKTGPSRFLSHLDMVRVFERALRRAELPVAYTEGFHPRIRLSFALALPVSANSRSEWADVDLTTPLAAAEVMARLNQTLSGGLEVFEARPTAWPGRAVADLVDLAIWRAHLPGADEEKLRTAIDELKSRVELKVIRQGKPRDLKPYILDLAVETGPVVKMDLRVRKDGSARPDEILTLLGHPPDLRQGASLTREALLHQVGDEWKELWEEPST